MPLVQRRFIGQTESEEPVRRKAADDKDGDLDAAAHHAVSTKGAGEPLRPAVLTGLESRVGVDLSSVRVHEGPAARESAAALNARAFTHKSDIWLGQGESQDNTHLMAHEVTHVIQQGSAPQSSAPAAAAAQVANSSEAAPAINSSGKGAASAAASSEPGGTVPAAAQASAKIAQGASPVKTAAGTKTGSATETAAAAPPASDAEPSKRAKSPRDDPAFQAVVKNVKVTAKGQKPKANETGKTKSGQAHAAVQSSAAEKPGRAAETGISHLPEEVKEAKQEQQPKPFDKEAFKEKLTKKIAQNPPQNLEEADNVKSPEKAAELKSSVLGEVDKDKTEAKQPTEKVDHKNLKPDGVPDLPFTPLQELVSGAVPYVPGAGAAPKPASDEDISVQEGPKQLDAQMADAQITDEQLQESNEAQFQSALAQKEDVGKQAIAAPQAFRAQETPLLHTAQMGAQAIAAKDMLAMHGAHTEQFKAVHGDQTKAKAAEEAKRAEIYKTVNTMYLETETAVKDRLDKLDVEINGSDGKAGLFDTGANEARAAFEFYVDFHMTKYKDDRYSGGWGAYHWVRDKFKDLPDEVNEFYRRGYVVYVDHMSAAIDKIATAVEKGLNDALKIISDGKEKIAKYVEGLDIESKKIGATAITDIQDKFDSLTQTVVDKQDELVNSLAKKYADNLQRLNDRITELKEANKGLVSKVAGAIKGVIEAIAHLKDLLLDVLSRAASAIGTIIAHPIRFLGHLVDAGMLGFNNFKNNIVEHLKDGFMQWLFGAVAKTGIELPKSFDLSGILSLVLQLLGLTYANIRARAVNIVGENVVKALETTAEIFKVLITKGPAGLWEYMQEKLGDILDTVIDSIKSFVMEKIIIAGVTWLIGLLNPASAFVKACKAIYDIVMFFVERGSQILDLVNAIIDSITAIASGNIDKAADFIEKSLARAIPVIIGFLASLLGVGGISEKIQKTIDTIRRPIYEAIDWVINKAYGLAKAAGGLLGIGKGKETEASKDGRPKWEAGVAGVTGDLAKMKANGLEEKDVQAKFPAWKSEYGFSDLQLTIVDDDFEISGAMSASKPVTKANTGLHSGTKNDPIPIYWYKPTGAYPPSVKLTDPNDNSKFDVPMESRVTVTDKYLGSVKIGTYAANQITPGKVLERTAGTEAMRGGKQASLISLFNRFGYDMGARSQEADHVKDLGFGGEDDFSNLWPLDGEINQRGLKYVNGYMVEYIEDKTIKKKSVKSLAGKYFSIKGFRYPAEKLGGRDSL